MTTRILAATLALAALAPAALAEDGVAVYALDGRELVGGGRDFVTELTVTPEGAGLPPRRPLGGRGQRGARRAARRAPPGGGARRLISATPTQEWLQCAAQQELPRSAR